MNVLTAIMIFFSVYIFITIVIKTVNSLKTGGEYNATLHVFILSVCVAVIYFVEASK